MANAIYWRCRSALTIIELLVIVASVVLLAVLVVPRFAADVDNRVLSLRTWSGRGRPAPYSSLEITSCL